MPKNNCKTVKPKLHQAILFKPRYFWLWGSILYMPMCHIINFKTEKNVIRQKSLVYNWIKWQFIGGNDTENRDL